MILSAYSNLKRTGSGSTCFGQAFALAAWLLLSTENERDIAHISQSRVPSNTASKLHLGLLTSLPLIRFIHEFSNSMRAIPDISLDVMLLLK